MTNNKILLYVFGGIFLLIAGGVIAIWVGEPTDDARVVAILGLAGFGGLFFGMGITNLAKGSLF